jgi:hypothetical protein
MDDFTNTPAAGKRLAPEIACTQPLSSGEAAAKQPEDAQDDSEWEHEYSAMETEVRQCVTLLLPHVCFLD